MQVLKFGGTSVANTENIRRVLAIIQHAAERDRTVVVVSAFSGITDFLIRCGLKAAEGDESYKEILQTMEQRHLESVRLLIPISQQSSVLSNIKMHFNQLEDICNGVFLLGELSERTRDRILSFGELMSSLIISAALAVQDLINQWKDSRELIRTDSQYGHAIVDFKLTNPVVARFFAESQARLVVAPGFVAADAKGNTTTLGRGGSDYTAAILAAAAGARRVEIWTDVSGMMTADPRLVAHVKSIPNISYQEAMELSHFGAKVIYPPTIQPLMNLGIPVWIKNTFAPQEAGTLIEQLANGGSSSIRGISSINRIALLSLEGSGMVGIPGFSKRLFEALALHRINVILITQGSSEHSICVGVEEGHADKAKQAVDQAFDQEIKTANLDPLVIEKDLAIVALVGDKMKSHPGISGKMFGALGRNGVNVRAIAQGSSERNISAVIASADVRKGINVLHEEFFETSYKQLNLFVAGAGNVGSRLLSQLRQQQPYLQEHLRLQVRVTGLANSRRMLFDDEGIDLANWKESLESGLPMQLDEWLRVIRSKNLRNAVFADITADQEVAACYDRLLQKSISVVACNKTACSGSLAYYRKLKGLAREFNAQLLFETNVGAGLPVIGTLNDLLRSGDQVHKIQAVLSGTLNFVFNHYEGTRPFADIVRKAQEEGYTEPDPRLDLSGVDVMRKIMILARESGSDLEMDDIRIDPFVPEDCMKGSIKDFYRCLASREEHFQKLYRDAHAAGRKLKFVANFEHGRAWVGLEQIDPQHDLYHLYGKDNVVLFYTDRYRDQPLVIKGAGAGAEVTASGVFADIIRAASS
jgi:aspartokinase/homoserine dehydrogenase 1